MVSLLALVSCGHPDNYIHTISDNSGIENLAITYLGTKAEIVAFRSTDSSAQSIHFDDSVMLTISSPEFTLKFPRFAEKYVNMNGDITITTNTYHDYFPTEWHSLRKANNYLTFKFMNDEQHLYYIIYNMANGEEIASYFEFE
jgi:hypothetical protein